MNKHKLVALLISVLVAISICPYATASSNETPTLEDLLSQIEALEKRVSALEEGASSSDISSDKILSDLTSFVWEGSTSDSIGRIVFADDGKLTMIAVQDENEESMPGKWVLTNNMIIVQPDGNNKSFTFVYNNENGSPALLWYNDGEVSMILKPVE